jgi:hypothetical protein
MLGMPFKIKDCAHECGSECGDNLTACPTYGELPQPLQEVCQNKLFLLQYLHGIPLSELGMPQYSQKINRSMKSV